MVRHRLLLEEEAVVFPFNAHGFQAAEKIFAGRLLAHFGGGWLEIRTSIWRDYKVDRDKDLNDWYENARLARVDSFRALGRFSGPAFRKAVRDTEQIEGSSYRVINHVLDACRLWIECWHRWHDDGPDFRCFGKGSQMFSMERAFT